MRDATFKSSQKISMVIAMIQSGFNAAAVLAERVVKVFYSMFFNNVYV